MKNKVRDHKDLETLLRVLALELVDAHVHFELLQNLLAAAQGAYSKAISQSSTFWSLTFQAHMDATLLRLCKAYDQHDDSLNLRNLLLTIQAHPISSRRRRFGND